MTKLQENWHEVLIAFNVLTCFAIFLIVLVMLPPLFAKTVRRRLPWYSHMISWLVVAIALLLLIGHQRDRHPPAGLCFVQSALLYAVVPLTTFSMACYILDINLALVSLLNNKTIRKKKRGLSIILTLTPWIVFWGVIIEVSIAFSTEPKSSFHSSGNPEFHLFCHYNSRLTNIVSITLAAVASLITMGVKVWTLILLIRKFKTYDWTSVKISQMILSAFIRTLLFTAIALVGGIIGQISCTLKTHDAAWSLVWPLIPIIAALVYGVHADVIRSLAFWKKTPDPERADGGVADPPRDEEEAVTTGAWKNVGSSGLPLNLEKPLPPTPV